LSRPWPGGMTNYYLPRGSFSAGRVRRSVGSLDDLAAFQHCVDIGRAMAGMQLLMRLTSDAVDDDATLNRSPCADFVHPPPHIGIAFCVQELGGAVHCVVHKAGKPGPTGHVGNAVFRPANE